MRDNGDGDDGSDDTHKDAAACVFSSGVHQELSCALFYILPGPYKP